MSRPNESEPIQNLCCRTSPSRVVISPVSIGRKSRLAASKSVGSTVPSQGAASATTRPPVAEPRPARRTRGSARPSVADPRVEEHVRQVHYQVDQHVGEREE